MNKLLARVKAKFDSANLENIRAKNKMDRVIKKYLFLFYNSTYTDRMQFKYSERTYPLDKWWFVNIIYHPNFSLTIHTGTYKKGFNGNEPVFDKPSDINKVINAFKIVMEKRTKNTIGDIKRIETSMNLIEELDNANLV
ncbi:hypothetical protein LCGC14_0911590 [marine sediment metagenome]|uniref:Uncharacterized protein n=1 Tax=marine sediment metagenome TaxID=412755 RepID=A0A0F9PEB9_9ZZZZ